MPFTKAVSSFPEASSSKSPCRSARFSVLNTVESTEQGIAFSIASWSSPKLTTRSTVPISRAEVEGLDGDAIMEAALEAGAEDVVEGENGFEVVTGPSEFHAVQEALSGAGFTPNSAEITMEPSTTVKLEGKEAEQMLRLADTLEDLDDVQNFYANFDIAEEELEKFA